MTRNGTNAGQRELAQHLVKYEECLRPGSAADVSGTQPVIERLQPFLVPLVGKVGFSSLLARALTLAKRESPSLREVRIEADCRLNGLTGDNSSEMVVLIAHLIALLTTFMGATLTIRLLRNAWPELPSLQGDSVEQINHHE